MLYIPDLGCMSGCSLCRISAGPTCLLPTDIMSLAAESVFGVWALHPVVTPRSLPLRKPVEEFGSTEHNWNGCSKCRHFLFSLEKNVATNRNRM